jgi:hypothetical protein
MFRPIALVGLLVLSLSACAETPARRDAAVGAPVDAGRTVSRSAPAPADDQSLRLEGSSANDGGSCRVQCERSYNICGDSVAARTQSGDDRPDRPSIFSPIDNCQYQLRQCFSRCDAAR